MHELQVTERILDIVLRHASAHEASKIVRIHLRIGELSGLEEQWVQRYFDYLSRGTPAENARLAVERGPITVLCDSCSRSFEVKKEELTSVACPDCGAFRCRVVSGREYLVKSIEVF